MGETERLTHSYVDMYQQLIAGPPLPRPDIAWH